MAMRRRKRTVTNARLPDGLVWRLLLPYKDCLKTITTDNGPEFAAHKDITRFLGVPVYFADPYCSWQKGAIENTNKLIRQYIQKKNRLNIIQTRELCRYKRN